MDSTVGRRTLRKQVRKKKRNLGVQPFLPDEIIANILSRLSVQFVIRCRLVCKTWRDLTLTQDFVDLNFRISLPLILAADFDDDDDVGDLILIDKWWGPKTSRIIHRFQFHLSPHMIYPLLSQGGLTVYSEYTEFPKPLTRFCIVNPIYPTEIVRITLSGVLNGSEIYGVFFHPSLKEYCSLLKIDASDKPRGFVILTLGSKPSLKTVVVSNLLDDRVMKPTTTTHLLLIGNCLYWMLECRRNEWKGWNDIMKFDITSEELIVIPCPVPSNTDCWFYQTLILDIDGILSYLLVSTCKFTIWRLKDDKEQLWTRSEYNINVEIRRRDFMLGIAVVNGKLAFLRSGRLYICNLVKGTVKKCRKRVQRGSWIDLSHQLSLASLSNCKPTISIDQDKDNKVVVVVEENQRVK